MSHFLTCNEVERKGIELVMPLLESWREPGTPFLWTNDAIRSEFWQKCLGDVILTHRHLKKHCAIEIKTENIWYGNIALESFSNRDFFKLSRGWLDYCRADFYLNVFLKEQVAVLFDMEKLWGWSSHENLRNYEEKDVHAWLQGKQLNRTRNICANYGAAIDGAEANCYRLVAGEWKFAKGHMSWK